MWGITPARSIASLSSVMLYFCYLGAHSKFRNPTTTPSGILVTAERRKKKYKKQARAELCQAQAQFSFLAEADLNLTVEFEI